MHSFLLGLALTLVACGDKDDDTGGAGGDGGAADGGSTDGGTDGGSGDGGSGDGGSDGGTGDGGSDGGGSDGGTEDGGTEDGGTEDGGADELDYTVGIDLVDSDADQFSAWTYDWNTYAVSASFEAPFTTADGLEPRFHVIWPAAPSTDGYPVMMMLHGASTDVDDTEPEGVDGRCTQANGTEQANDVVTRSALVQQALFDGFVVVVPENGFCDGWAGFGPDDPNDPTHAGYFLERVAMGFLRWGQDHLAVDEDRIFIVGTSLGATGTPVFASSYDAVAGIIYDSGAPDFVRYTEEDGYSGIKLETRQSRGYHIMGGSAFEADGTTPSSLYDRYVGHSLDRGVREGGLRVPAFVIANAQDPVAPSEMYDGIEDTFDDAGLSRWTYHDVDHSSPGHTQIHSPAASYATYGALRFAHGRSVRFLEAEGRTGSGWVGEDVLDTTPYASASGGDVRLAPRGTSGVLVEIPLPEEAVGEVNATVFMTVTSATDPSATSVVLSLYSDADGTLEGLELSQASTDWSASDSSSVRSRIETTTLSGTLTEQGYIYIEVTGIATVAVDVVVVDW